MANLLGTCARKEEDMSSYTEGQVHQLMDAFEKEGATAAELTNLGQSPELIRSTLGSIRGKPRKSYEGAMSCTQSLDPANFIGAGWRFWRGPANGNGLGGETEQDDRSASLPEFDQTKVCLVTTLRPGEPSITGEENLARLEEAGHVRLGEKHFFALWEKKDSIPESWKEKVNGNTRFIYFDGTVLRDPDGSRYVLYLDWSDGRWGWFVSWLGNVRDVHDLSASLAS